MDSKQKVQIKRLFVQDWVKEELGTEWELDEEQA